MGFLLFLAVAALGAIAWLLFRIDTKLQVIGDMIHDASRPEEQPRLKPGEEIHEEASAEEAAAEKKPAEEVPAEEAPAKETAAEEKPAKGMPGGSGKQEANERDEATEDLALIDRLLAKPDISKELQSDLLDRQEDIAEGRFTEEDRKYLRALLARLSGQKS